MSASTSGALKAFLEGQGLGISVYRDEAPKDTPRPYLIVNPAIAVVPGPLEDGVATEVVEQVALDVWMDFKDPISGARLESFTLPSATMKALQGVRLATAPTLVYGVLVRHGMRILERNENNGAGIVHFVIQLDIFRTL